MIQKLKKALAVVWWIAIIVLIVTNLVRRRYEGAGLWFIIGMTDMQIKLINYRLDRIRLGIE